MPGINPKNNLIINGDCYFAQRGAAPSITTNASFYVVDRIRAGNSVAGCTCTASQNSLTSSDLPYKVGIQNSVKLVCSTYAAGSSGQNNYIQYIVEGLDFVTINSKMANYSFLVRASRTGVLPVLILNNAATRRFVFECQITSANTWQEVSIPINFKSGTSSGVWSFDTNPGTVIYLLPYINGATGLTNNTWVTDSTNLTTANASANQIFQANGDFIEVTGFRLTEGAEKQPFRRAGGSIGGELALCQRYYEKSYEVGTTPGTPTVSGVIGNLWNSGVNATGYLGQGCQFKTQKRSAAVITCYDSIGTMNRIYGHRNDGSAIESITGYQLANQGLNGFAIYLASAPTIAGMEYHFTADSDY